MFSPGVLKKEDFAEMIHDKNRKIKQNDIKKKIVLLKNQFKHSLLNELEDKIKECTKKENKIEELTTQNINLRSWIDIILKELQDCKSSDESKASFNETLIDILHSSICSESNVSAYYSPTEYDDLVERLAKKDIEIKKLTGEVECLRYEKTTMSSELNTLKDKLEEIDNNFNDNLLLRPSLERISLTNLMNLNEEHLKVPQRDISIATEMSGNIQFMDPTIRVEGEHFKKKIKELEMRLFECNQKLHETIATMKSHQCQISYKDGIEEDNTQSSIEEGVNEKCFIDLEKTKKARVEKIKSLEDVNEYLKAELLPSNKQKNDKMGDRKSSFHSKNTLITIVDFIVVALKPFF
uniref:E3 ubiquitin protein ligase n=1 Tax=Strongyloides papillosus TaxID=174720 RepID=A0A0N5C0V2_STREA